jgi:hypothetical protein
MAQPQIPGIPFALPREKHTALMGLLRASLSVLIIGYLITGHFCQRDFVGLPKKSLVIKENKPLFEVKVGEFVPDFVIA